MPDAVNQPTPSPAKSVLPAAPPPGKPPRRFVQVGENLWVNPLHIISVTHFPTWTSPDGNEHPAHSMLMSAHQFTMYSNWPFEVIMEALNDGGRP